MRMSTSMLNQTAVNTILDQQNALSKTQQQISTGLRVQTPADDPVAAVQLLQLNDTQAQYQQFISNGQNVTTRLTLQEQALSDSTTTLQSIRDLVVQANSGSNNTSDLKSIATNIHGLEQQLQGIANRQDASGAYLFAGYSSTVQPFVRGATGTMNYVGDNGTQSVQIDTSTSIQMGDAGSTIYMNVPAGNGTFTTAAGTGNTGTGVIDTGSVTSASSWVPGQYTVTFTDATHWAVTDAAGSPVTDASGNAVTGTYDGSSGNVSFDGVSVGITGAPAAGDTFRVSTAGKEGVFTTLDKLVSNLNNAGSTPAARAQLATALGGTLQQIDQALAQVSTVTSNVGGRLSLVSSTATSLTSQSTTLTGQISNLANVDFVSATAQLSQQYVGLQAALSSYAQTAQLSLFKYL